MEQEDSVVVLKENQEFSEDCTVMNIINNGYDHNVVILFLYDIHILFSECAI